MCRHVDCVEFIKLVDYEMMEPMFDKKRVQIFTQTDIDDVCDFFKKRFSIDFLIEDVDYFYKTDHGDARSWISMDRNMRFIIIYLGHCDDLYHELVHVLDSIFGEEKLCVMLGVDYDELFEETFHANLAEYGGTALYDEEDFAEMLEPILKKIYEEGSR